jgi:hypothetical protein
MFLHDKCLLESIIKLKNINCTICKEEYKNIKYTTKKKYRLENSGKLLIYRVLLLNCFILLTFIEFIIYIENYNDYESINYNKTNNYNKIIKNKNETTKIILLGFAYSFLVTSIASFFELINFTIILYENRIPIISYKEIKTPYIDHNYNIC